MRTFPGLGSANVAVISLYLAPLWGIEALRALRAPLQGLDILTHANAVTYYRQLFDFGIHGLIGASNVLAGAKLLAAAAFLAFLIDFARALAVGRDANRETLDAVLLLSIVCIVLWIWPALATGEATLVRLHATHALMLAGAVIVVVMERHIRASQGPVATRSEWIATQGDSAWLYRPVSVARRG